MDDDKTPPEDLESTESIGSRDSGPPERVGPYRILQKIGEGGMGVVYLAEQTEPLRRKVALKIIKHGMDTKQVVARFEAERQALAMMDHTCVARVFDAGSTEAGRPYFAMEYVQGVPITEHCDRQRLTTRERLELFQQVCEGVQHAHQKAIIHRDLKPSNVLVSYRDGKARPKIIDFGVAKAIEHRLTEKTLFTELGVLIGTPEYMSPEQAEMTGQNIDTRTDVYSLGVVLYELLVGALPFESKELRQFGFDEIRRKVREDEPPKPSARLTTLGSERSTESAKRRRTDPPTLRRELSGDLDWITMRALEKDRGRRYGSPSELAADVERHLTSQPVSAGPPSAGYRAGKFVRRHRVGMSAAAAGGLVLLAFAVTMAVQAKRIAAERDRAEQAKADLESVVEFQAGMLSEVDPEQMGRWLIDELRESEFEARRTRGAAEAELATIGLLFTDVNPTNIALRVIDDSILNPAGKALETRFEDQPLIGSELRATIGETYRKLGLYDQAEPHMLAARETRSRLLGDEHPETLEATHNLSNLYWYQGRYDEVESLVLELLATRKSVLGEDHPDTLRSMHNLAMLYGNQGRYVEAEPLYLETLESLRHVLGTDHSVTLLCMHNLASMYRDQGRYDEAELLSVEALEAQKRMVGDDDWRTLKSMDNLGGIYVAQGRYDEAEPLHLATLESRKRKFGDDHPDTLSSVDYLANLYRI